MVNEIFMIENEIVNVYSMQQRKCRCHISCIIHQRIMHLMHHHAHCDRRRDQRSEERLIGPKEFIGVEDRPFSRMDRQFQDWRNSEKLLACDVSQSVVSGERVPKFLEKHIFIYRFIVAAPVDNEAPYIRLSGSPKVIQRI